MNTFRQAARVGIVDFSLVGKKEALEFDFYFESCSTHACA